MKGNNGYREAVPEQFSIARKILQQKEEAMIADYYWCRAHHRQMWSTIARLDDETILEFSFDIGLLKRQVALDLGLDTSRIWDQSYCYACAWTKDLHLHKGCEPCPIKYNLGENCTYNVYRQLTNITVKYSYLAGTGSLRRSLYWKEHVKVFRSLALEMANAW